MVGIKFIDDGKYVFIVFGLVNYVVVVDVKIYEVLDYLLVGCCVW